MHVAYKNFVHFVGLYTYCRMIHGAYKNFMYLVDLYTYCGMIHGAYKNFVHLVGLYTYCRMMHGAYIVKLNEPLLHSDREDFKKKSRRA